MERAAVVVALTGERDELLDMLRSLFGSELEAECAEIGGDHGFEGAWIKRWGSLPLRGGGQKKDGEGAGQHPLYVIQSNIMAAMKRRLLVVISAAFSAVLSAQSGPLGLFEDRGDVGTVLNPGAVQYDAAKKIYTITGSGDNMWAAADAFQFVWKKMSGDVDLSADIAFANSTGDPHKKAVLMIRQTLDADSPYVDVALHNVGLTSLQAREAEGVATHEIESAVSAPKHVRILKRGDTFYMFAGDQMAGGSFKVPLTGAFYVGLGVCAHNKDVSETATFSNVSLSTPPPVAAISKPTLYSTVETITVTSTDRKVTFVSPERLEAPNWTPDGKSLIFNGNGHILRVPVDGGKPETPKPEIIETGMLDRVNNDHGISPDGNMLAISDQSQDQRKSIVYTVPIGGGTPKRITMSPLASYFHGWSPDGKTLAFVGDRNGNLDIYTIPASGGEETRLTTAEGLDDGPEFSPDGQYIYFNSERTGSMQIWRMKPDGSAQEQITSDGLNNWFPHVSPNGRQIVFLSYEKDVTGHPADKDVTLRIMNLADKKITVLTKLFGGQGTINVPSWSPDSRRLAFVSYQYLP
jgi:TolB protein